jgi:hypothetical protein
MKTCQGPPMGTAERREGCFHADQAAIAASDKSVKKMFAILGVNVDEPHEVEDFRKDLRFGSQLRRDVGRGRLMIVAMIATAIGYAVLEGVKHFMGKP